MVGAEVRSRQGSRGVGGTSGRGGRHGWPGERAAGGREDRCGREREKSNSLIPCRKEKITTHPMWVGSLSYISPIRHTWKVQIQEARLYIVTSLSRGSL